MNASRFLVYVAGLLLLVIAGWLVVLATGLHEVVPLAVFVGGTLIFLGIGLMAGADRLDARSDVVVERRRWA